ncbi:Modification methylase HaeIII [compost metagenome]
MCHPTQNRPLSVKEYARIQQFPEDWIIEGSVDDIYRQIGNAVPAGLGKAIGQVLLAVAEGNSQIQTKRLRGTSVHKMLQEVAATREIEIV